MAEVLKSCPFEEPIGKYEIEKAEKPLTEQEWLQTATTEQLAEKLWELYNAGKDDAKTYDTFEYFIDKEDVVGWLKQLHND